MASFKWPSASNVTSIDGITGDVTLVAGPGISITDNSPVAGSITITNTSPAPALTNLTDVGTDGITITNGTGAVIGASPVTISQHVADTTHNGYLSSTDWNTFNSKLSALDSTYSLANASDPTKLQKWDLSGQTTATTLTIAPQNTSNMTLHVPQVATASGTGMALVQDETTGFIFSFGITSSLGGANSMMQLANASTANRAQIKLHSYFNGTSIAGVSTLTSRSGTIGTNAAVVAGQDYSKWTAQACATTPGSAPIAGTWSFKANTVNSLTVTSDFHLQLTNLAGTLADRFYLTSEGIPQFTGLNVAGGYVQSDATGVLSSAVIPNADATHTGFLTSTDWSTFNGKQDAGNYITALTGDVTASGPGSAATTLATVNSNVGSFGSSTSIPSFTVNAKGLITAASGNVVIAPAGTLTGTTLASNVVTSSLTTVGTIGTGTWQGTAVAIGFGGTGQTTKAAAFDALSPMTTGGDIIYGGASGTGTRLANGSSGQVLTSNGGTSAPSWQPAAATFTKPTVQKFTLGSGTYTLPANVRWIQVEMVGGGGGGAGSGTAGGGDGTDGADTTFGSNLAGGGGKGTFDGGATTGGGVTLSDIVGISAPGGAGGGSNDGPNVATGAGPSGQGGASMLGGNGGGGSTGGNGTAGRTNTGGGGGGAGVNQAANALSGAGGAAGGGIRGIITSPSATYSYAVGAGGSAGSAGTGGHTGGAGGSGVIVVTEYYV